MAVMDLVGQRPLGSSANALVACATPLRARSMKSVNPVIHALDELPNGKQLEEELLALGRQPSVPAVFIGGKLVGVKEIIALQLKGELVDMLIDNSKYVIWV